METPTLKFARFVTFGTVSANRRSVSLRNKANYLHAINVNDITYIYTILVYHKSLVLSRVLSKRKFNNG